MSPPLDTSYALERIDVGDFESLAAGYLSRTVPGLSGLISTGTNSVGKPIPCPIDGVLFVHGTPPRAVAAAATTTLPAGLRKKWLDAETGDVQKAAKELAQWTVPGLNRELYLVTSQMLESDLPLYRDTIQVGLWLGIEVVIVEGSQLIRFLDTDREGQYLRHLYFGIDAERVSESLLRAIALRSLEQHRLAFPVDVEHEVARDLTDRLVTRCTRTGESIIVLEGPSGTGKSTLGRQVATAINKMGGIGLWIAAEDVSPQEPFESALLRTLRRFEPRLDGHSGADAIKITSQLPVGLVLLVDDINRYRSPQLAWEGIVGWTQSAQSGPSLRCLVPLWPERLAEPIHRGSSTRRSAETFGVGSFAPNERDQLAELFEFRGQDPHGLIDALDGDPFLCGLALAGERSDYSAGSRADLVRRVVEHYVARAARLVSDLPNLHATPQEVEDALDEMIGLVLEWREPEPPWNRLRAALGDSRSNILYGLGQLRAVGWIWNEGTGEVWRWKHERLRNALVARWIAIHKMIDVRGDKQPDRLLDDPGLAESLALAAAFADETDRETMVERLCAREVLVAAETLKLNLFVDRPGVERHATQTLQAAVQSQRAGVSYPLVSPEEILYGRLMQTNNPAILVVTSSMASGWHKAVARFRNGDVDAGLRWMQSEMRYDRFLPGVNYSLLEGTIEAFAKTVANRGDVLRALTAALDVELLREAALVLAGYLAWPELVAAMAQRWSELSEENRTQHVAAGVWMLSRACTAEIEPELEAALALVERLNDAEQVDGGIHRPGDRSRLFLEPLDHSRRWAITDRAVSCWVRVALARPELSETLYWLLRGMDHPAAAEAYIRWRAKRDGLYAEDFQTVDPLADETRDVMLRIPRANATRSRLREIVASDPDPDVRRAAFAFWRRSGERDDIPFLASIDVQDALYDEALKTRLKLRDDSAAPVLIGKLESDPGRWCSYVPLIYGAPGVALALEQHLEVALMDRRASAADIFLHLSEGAISRLSERKREVLLRTSEAWRSLWRSGYRDALDVVQEALGSASEDSLRFFFLRDGFPYEVSATMLDAVAPFVDRFPEDERQRLAEIALRAGQHAWAIRNLPQWIPTNHVQWSDSTAGLVALDVIAAAFGDDSEFRHALFRLEGDLRHSELKGSEVLARIREWLDRGIDERKIVVAAIIVGWVGTGDDELWWADLSPPAGIAHEAWADTQYVLRVRRWTAETRFAKTAA